MPFDGSGNFVALAAPVFPAVGGATIASAYYNQVINDILGGLSLCVTRNGQSAWTANMPAGGYKLTNVGGATANGQALVYGQTNAFMTNAIFAGSLINNLTSAGDWNFGHTTPDGSDNRRIVMYSGGAASNSRGAYMVLAGNEAATNPGQISLNPGAGGAVVAVGGPLTVSGAATFNGGMSPSTDLTYTSSAWKIAASTADAADTAQVSISGGGAPSTSRGAYIVFYGNEHATQPGDLLLRAGSAGSVAISGDTAITGTLSATGGAAASILTSGTVATARLGSGGASNTTYLRGDQTWSTPVLSFNGRTGAVVPAVNDYDYTDISGTVPAADLSSAAVYNISSAQVDGFDVGYKNIPRRTSGLAEGQCTALAAGVTINTSDLATGKVFSIYNNSAAAINITQGAGVTMRLSGTSTTGTLSLAARGFATFWCNSATEVIAAGPLS